MFQHLIYKCPKCKNTLLVSNKMLHDLRCTEENPATYENILRQSQIMDNVPQSPYDQNISSPRLSSGVRRSNNDGTSSEIQKSINMNGEEEYIETRYDPEGNIISRKKADNLGYSIPQSNNYQDVSEFYEYEDNNNYVNENIENQYYIEPSVGINNNQEIVYEAAAQEIVYEAPAQYDPNITINKPIQQTIINTDGNISDNIMNDIIRSSMTKAGNTSVNISINSANIANNLGNINNINDITTYNYNQTNIINNITSDPYSNPNIPNFGSNFNYSNNQDLNLNGIDLNNNNTINLNMNPDDVLRRTAGIGSHNFNNVEYNY